jgi:hypothetical protein
MNAAGNPQHQPRTNACWSSWATRLQRPAASVISHGKSQATRQQQQQQQRSVPGVPRAAASGVAPPPPAAVLAARATVAALPASAKAYHGLASASTRDSSSPSPALLGPNPMRLAAQVAAACTATSPRLPSATSGGPAAAQSPRRWRRPQRLALSEKLARGQQPRCGSARSRARYGDASIGTLHNVQLAGSSNGGSYESMSDYLCIPLPPPISRAGPSRGHQQVRGSSCLSSSSAISRAAPAFAALVVCMTAWRLAPRPAKY